MTTYTPPVTRAMFRRTAIMAGVVAAVAVVVLVVLGYGLYGLFLAVGVALGTLNLWLAVRSVAQLRLGAPVEGALLRLGARPPRAGHRDRVGDRVARAPRGHRGDRRPRAVPVPRDHQLDAAVDQGDPTEMILAAEGTITPGEHWTVQLGRADVQRRHDPRHDRRRTHRVRAGLLHGQPGDPRPPVGPPGRVRGAHGLGAEPDQGGHGRPHAARRRGLLRHRVRVHPHVQLAGRAAVGALAARRPPRTSTSSTRWRCW